MSIIPTIGSKRTGLHTHRACMALAGRPCDLRELLLIG